MGKNTVKYYKLILVCYNGEKMKRIDAIIPIERLNSVNEALRLVEMSGVTVLYSAGRGQIPIEQKNTGEQAAFISDFSSNCTIIVVVKDTEVEKVILSILEGAGKGMRKEGKIFVSDVIDVVDIGSKQRGEKAI